MFWFQAISGSDPWNFPECQLYRALQPRDVVIDGCLVILGCLCRYWTFRRGAVGWCAWSLSLPWQSAAVCWAWAAAWTRVSWRVQFCYKGHFLGCPEQQRQCLNWELCLQFPLAQKVPPSLLSCPQVSFPLCLSGNSAWPPRGVPPWPRVCVVLTALMDFSEIVDKLGCGLCLTHEIATVALLSHGGDSSRGRNFWSFCIPLMQPAVLSSCLLADSISATGRLRKQLKWGKAHKNSSLLPNRKGKYFCEICLESWVSSLGEMLFMSQNQPLFLLVSKDWCWWV